MYRALYNLQQSSIMHNLHKLLQFLQFVSHPNCGTLWVQCIDYVYNLFTQGQYKRDKPRFMSQSAAVRRLSVLFLDTTGCRIPAICKSDYVRRIGTEDKGFLFKSWMSEAGDARESHE